MFKDFVVKSCSGYFAKLSIYIFNLEQNSMGPFLFTFFLCQVVNFFAVTEFLCGNEEKKMLIFKSHISLK